MGLECKYLCESVGKVFFVFQENQSEKYYAYIESKLEKSGGAIKKRKKRPRIQENKLSVSLMNFNIPKLHKQKKKHKEIFEMLEEEYISLREGDFSKPFQVFIYIFYVYLYLDFEMH